jgi:hypothetical protein
MHIIVHYSRGGEDGPREDVGASPGPWGASDVCRVALLAALAAAGVECGRYFTRFIMLNIGRYMEMTMSPTSPPTNSIMIGSMIEVSDLTAASTSSS